MTESHKNWDVGYSSSADKRKSDLPKKIKDLLDTLTKEIELLGPIRKDWPNFSSLSKAKGIPKDS